VRLNEINNKGDEMEKINELIKSCIIIFELTGRSVPSNHFQKVQQEIEKLKKLIEVKDEEVRSNE